MLLLLVSGSVNPVGHCYCYNRGHCWSPKSADVKPHPDGFQWNSRTKKRNDRQVVTGTGRGSIPRVTYIYIYILVGQGTVTRFPPTVA